MIGDLALREDELGGKTLLLVGLGQIGGRLAQLAKAFDMRVVASAGTPPPAPARPTRYTHVRASSRCCRRRISSRCPAR